MDLQKIVPRAVNTIIILVALVVLQLSAFGQEGYQRGLVVPRSIDLQVDKSGLHDSDWVRSIDVESLAEHAIQASGWTIDHASEVFVSLSVTRNDKHQLEVRVFAGASQVGAIGSIEEDGGGIGSLSSAKTLSLEEKDTALLLASVDQMVSGVAQRFRRDLTMRVAMRKVQKSVYGWQCDGGLEKPQDVDGND